jgi:hypothetical protein
MPVDYRAEGATADAWRHVFEGYKAALTVPGLPEVEIEDLRACYRAAAQIAGESIVTTTEGDE